MRARLGSLVSMEDLAGTVLYHRRPGEAWSAVYIPLKVTVRPDGELSRLWTGIRFCPPKAREIGVRLQPSRYLAYEAGELVEITIGIYGPTGASAPATAYCGASADTCPASPEPSCVMRYCWPVIWTVGTPYPPSGSEVCEWN